jgi:hypothetical protein
VGLVPKSGCVLTLAYYAFLIWYEFGERRWNYILTDEHRRTRRKNPVPVPLCPPQIPRGLTRVRGLTTCAMARPCDMILQNCTRTTQDTLASSGLRVRSLVVNPWVQEKSLTNTKIPSYNVWYCRSVRTMAWYINSRSLEVSWQVHMPGSIWELLTQCAVSGSYARQ